MKGFIILGLSVSSILSAQNTHVDTTKVQEIESIVFLKRLPVSKEIINVQRDLDYKNLGQDLPILLKNQMSVISTSDAGNGVGYTGFRIRGVGSNGINVMLNGIPYNDSESQGAFFVNVPDITSAASQIVIQRGVGTSSNGVAAFGASVNIISKDPSEEFNVKAETALGSYNTQKYSTEIASGKFWKNKLSVLGRYSMIHSDGYIDRAFSNLNSYYFSGLYEEGRTKLRFITFGGKEKTYQAWNAVSKQQWEAEPTFNNSGAIYDGNRKNIIGFYDNETDNYNQKHHQLLLEQNLNNHWNLETAIHYTKGSGYYENYKQDSKFSKYNIEPLLINNQIITRSDLIRKKWLDNDFYGIVSTLHGNLENLDLQFGVVANQYVGYHFGEVSGAKLSQIRDHEYYRNKATKNELSGYAKGIVKIDKFEIFGDLQLRNIDYTTEVLLKGDNEGVDLTKNWTFFNPKAGINYKIPAGKLFFSYALAHREPNRSDLSSNTETQPERLHDYEFGIEKTIGKFAFTTNLYYMNYLNQLVLNGKIDDIGVPIRVNSGKSYRMGMEFGASTKLVKQLEISANATLSKNSNIDFNEETDTGVRNLGNTPISFSPDIMANVLLRYSPSKNISLTVQNQYVGTQFLDNSNDVTFQLPAYYLMDLGLQYSTNINKSILDFKFLLNNIFDKKYVNNGFVSSDTPFYFAQAGTNFMLGVTIGFK